MLRTMLTIVIFFNCMHTVKGKTQRGLQHIAHPHFHDIAQGQNGAVGETRPQIVISAAVVVEGLDDPSQFIGTEDADKSRFLLALESLDHMESGGFQDAAPAPLSMFIFYEKTVSVADGPRLPERLLADGSAPRDAHELALQEVGGVADVMQDLEQHIRRA